MKKKSILILGGGGFIGSRLSLQLSALHYKVTVLDAFNHQIHGDDYTQSFLYQQLPDNVKIVNLNILDATALLPYLQENEIVVHMVSETGTSESMYRLQRYTEVNIGSVSVLLDVIVNHKTKVKKVFLASSRAVYGEGRYLDDQGKEYYPNSRKKSNLENGIFDVLNQKGKALIYRPMSEIDEIHPVSIYGFSKYAQEQLLKITCATYGIDFCILRYQNVFGAGQSILNSYTGVLNVFTSRALQNKSLEIFEDGKGLRDFIYIDDAVKATILAIENSTSDNKVYNIGTGKGINILDAAISISKLLGQEVVCEISGNYRFGDIRHSIADITAIQKDLNFYPEYSFSQGLELFINWVKTQDYSLEKSDFTLMENKNKGILRIKK
jgi:dTDP-L-rhamnose 4-epimerase